MARDCAVCGDLTCDCRECYRPGRGNGVAESFGVCRTCAYDLARLAGEGSSPRSNESLEYGVPTRRSSDGAKAAIIWLTRNPLPQRKSTRNTTQPMRAGVSS